MTLRVFLMAGLLMGSLLGSEPNSPIKPSDYKDSVKVACVGDSLTQGAGCGPGMAYPEQLQKMLGDKWKVGNFGVSGRTILKKGDNPYWNEKAYQDARGFAPDVVIIMLGSNDTKPHNWKFESEFVADYTELVKSFQALESKPRIFICRPCPVIEPGNFQISEKNLQEWIKRIDQLAKDMNLGLIDMHKPLEDHPELFPDLVHPNDAGAAIMAATAYKVLTGESAPKADPEKQPAKN